MASTRSNSAPSSSGGDGETSLEALALAKVAEAADAIAAAASAGEVVRALHAVAALLFPVDSAAVAGEAPSPNPLTYPRISHSYHLWSQLVLFACAILPAGTVEEPFRTLVSLIVCF